MSQTLTIDEIVRRISKDRESIPADILPMIKEYDIELLAVALADHKFHYAIGELLSLPENHGEERFKAVMISACERYIANDNDYGVYSRDNAIWWAFLANPAKGTWLLTTWPGSAVFLALHAAETDRHQGNTCVMDAFLGCAPWELLFPEGGTWEEFESSPLQRAMTNIPPDRIIAEILPKMPWVIIFTAKERHCSPVEVVRAFPDYTERIVLEMPDWAYTLALKLPNLAERIASVAEPKQIADILAHYREYSEAKVISIVEAIRATN